MCSKNLSVFEVLDNSIKAGDISLLDNFNFDFAKGKLSVFVNENHWLITFQFLGISKLGPSIDVQIVGSDVTSGSDGILWEEPFIFLDKQGNYIDIEDVEAGFTKDNFEISVRNKTFNFKVGKDLKERINDKNEWITALREMVKNKNFLELVWLTEEEQLEQAALSSSYYCIYSTENWPHPVSDTDSTQNYSFFKSVAHAISKNNADYIVDNEESNTYWEIWEKFDSVNFW